MCQIRRQFGACDQLELTNESIALAGWSSFYAKDTNIRFNFKCESTYGGLHIANLYKLIVYKFLMGLNDPQFVHLSLYRIGIKYETD
jgi:hypothetical protein